MTTKVSTEEKTLYVSFQNQQVAVSFESDEIRRSFELAFQPLLTSEPNDLLHTMRVRRLDNGYTVDGAWEFLSDDRSFRSTLQCVKFEIIHKFVDQHPDMLWLHAGAAASSGKAVILCGAWGRGKSTMVSFLCEKGWTYLSDDIVPIDMRTGKLVPFPLTPMRREHGSEDHQQMLSATEVSTLQKRIIELETSSFAIENVTPFAIVFPKYDPDSEVQLTDFPPAAATVELLENCLNLRNHKSFAVRYLSQMVEQYPVYGLQYNDGDKASDRIVELV